MKYIHPVIKSLLHNPLLLILMWSVFALGTVWIRMTVTGSDYYVFMVWNLVLALVPLLISHLTVTHTFVRGKTPLLFACTILVWLLFFPNTFYMVTDFIHLQERNGVPLWYDAILLMSFASAGLYIGFISLSYMHIVIRKLVSARAGWIFTYTTLILTGFGIYFGRFLRWNSWDILTDPAKILRMSSAWVVNPFLYPRILFVSAVFSGFCIAFYLLMLAAHDSFFNRKYPDVR